MFSKKIILLQVAAASVFLGRAFQHIFWDAPFRTLLWDEEIMSGIVHRMSGLSWEEYLTNPSTDVAIQSWIMGFGVFYLGLGIFCLVVKKVPSWMHGILWLGAFALVVLAALYCKEKFYSLGQFFEYALQFGAPIFLFFVLAENRSNKNLNFWMRLALALTFTCHGLYAVNYYPRPGLFVEMTYRILGVNEARAILFLNLAGALDFIISAIVLFAPRSWWKPALAYAVFWGFATAIARVWAHVHIDYFAESMWQWGYETLYRFPHFLIPAYLYLDLD